MEVDKDKINIVNKYRGYKFEKTNPAPIPEEVNNGDVIKVYYVKNNYNYTVEYYLDGVKDESKTEKVAYESRIEEADVEIKEISGYRFEKIENVPLVVSDNEEENIIKVYYLSEYTITVNHIDRYTNTIKDKEDIKKVKGERYRLEAKQYAKYDLEDIQGNTEGIVNGNIEVNYYYRKQVKIEVKYVDKETGKELLEKVVNEGHQGDNYKLEEKEIKYFRLIESPEILEGEMKEDATFIYYYEPLKFNLKVVNAITKIIKDGEENNVNLKLGKTEIHRKKLNETNVKVELTIKVINNGEIEGNASLVQNIPEGFEMKEEDNEGWIIDGKLALTRIKNIKIGETREYKVVLTWNQGELNLGVKDYVTYLSNIQNDAGREEESVEDDEDKSTIILSVSTGEKRIGGYTIAAIVLSTIVLIVVTVKRKE